MSYKPNCNTYEYNNSKPFSDTRISAIEGLTSLNNKINTSDFLNSYNFEKKQSDNTSCEYLNQSYSPEIGR
jgi:hypothetical protein